MERFVHCYAIPGKSKALRLLDAFAAGAVRCGVGAYVWNQPPAQLDRGAAAFYGVRPVVAHLWDQAKAEGRDWYYLDNAYFDADRERFFRITKNAVQSDGIAVLRVGADLPQPAPWRQDGTHIVLCTQSDEFLCTVAGWPDGTEGWVRHVTAELRKLTARPIRVRRKGDKRPLAADLDGAWALVTHTSAAANEAAMAGVPVFVTGRCAAAAVSMNQGVASFARIEKRPTGFDLRPQWAAVLKASQWTLDEIRRGDAWRALNP